ncbi:Cyclic nucleotide-binding domain-containing protein [Durusdinium trenchii]
MESNSSASQVAVPFRIADGRPPHRDLLLPEQGLLDMIAKLRSERHHLDVIGDAPVDDTETSEKQEVPEGKVLRLPKLGPRLPREPLEQAAQPHAGSPHRGMPDEDDVPPRLPRGGDVPQHLDPTRLQHARATLPFTPRQLPQVGELGERPPDHEERRWIEAAVRRMFLLLSPAHYEALMEAFREWKLPPATVIVKQATPVSQGPSLCVLLDGVIDVLHCPTGATTSEKVCTYDRCGQCFGELELFYEKRGQGAGRKLHWATIATRTEVTLWTVAAPVAL